MNKQYNKYNFHKYTFCEYKEVTSEAIQKLNLSYKSKSGSSYYFTEKGVFRISNHWGRASNCRWRLEPISNANYNNQFQKPISKINNSNERIGYANWTDFYPNNEQEKLFYIEINWITNEVNFQHKNNTKYKTEFILRNALATAKRIQIIKEVLTEENWSKHLIFDDLAQLRAEIIRKLIETDETFIKIKQNYL